VIGVFIAILAFLSEHHKDYPPNLFDALRRELNDRTASFMGSFELVLEHRPFCQWPSETGYCRSGEQCSDQTDRIVSA